MVRAHTFCVVFALAAASTWAQDIITAQRYFEQVSEAFGAIKDYTCTLTLTRGDTISTGRLSYKSPNLLRLDYTNPPNQVLLADGKKLQIYVPSQNLILEQDLRNRSSAELEGMASSRALRLLSEGFDISYVDTPELVPLGPGSTEQVVKLRLTRRLPREMYREIVLSVTNDKLIRRMQGVLEDHSEIVMDYAGIRLNQNLSDNRFQAEQWPEAYVVRDFLSGGN